MESCIVGVEGRMRGDEDGKGGWVGIHRKQKVEGGSLFKRLFKGVGGGRLRRWLWIRFVWWFRSEHLTRLRKEVNDGGSILGGGPGEEVSSGG